jgi:uncharacterized membrane protein
MNYLTKIDDDTDEIGRLASQRDRYDPADGRQARERDAVDKRIEMVTARRDALRASLPALEELDSAITAAEDDRKTAGEDLRADLRETLERGWPTLVLFAVVITTRLCGVDLFPSTWWGNFAGGLVGAVIGWCAARVLWFLLLVFEFIDARRDHAKLIDERDRTLADIEEGRPVPTVNW